MTARLHPSHPRLCLAAVAGGSVPFLLLAFFRRTVFHMPRAANSILLNWKNHGPQVHPRADLLNTELGMRG